MINLSSTAKNKVIDTLTNYPKSRDNDNLLVCLIWKEEIGVDIKTVPTNTFFNIMSSGKLTAYETIRRIRAKLQSEDPELRGINYEKRARKKEEIKRDIIDFDWI